MGRTFAVTMAGLRAGSHCLQEDVEMRAGLVFEPARPARRKLTSIAATAMFALGSVVAFAQQPAPPAQPVPAPKAAPTPRPVQPAQKQPAPPAKQPAQQQAPIAPAKPAPAAPAGNETDPAVPLAQ